jgi:hypothetical protein
VERREWNSLKACVHEALQEIIDLPKAADADWLKKLEEE